MAAALARIVLVLLCLGGSAHAQRGADNINVNGQLVMAPLPEMTWVGVQNVGIHIKDNTSGAVDGAYNSFYLRPIRWQQNVDFSRFTSIAQKNNEIKVGFMGW